MRQFLRLAIVLAGSATALASASSRAAPHAAATRPAAPAPVPAVAASVYDMSMLPAFSGTVAQYIPSPAGGVSGVILTDGTQILVSPDLAWDLPKILKPGDRVTGNGLKGKTLPLIRAFSLTGPRGQRTEDTGITLPPHAPEMIAGPDIVVHGTVWLKLYDMRGTLAGAVLKDHTIIRLPSRGAEKVAAWLTPGATLYAAGPGTSGELGTALNAHQIGPTPEQTISIAADDVPPPGPPAGSPGYDIITSAETH